MTTRSRDRFVLVSDAVIRCIDTFMQGDGGEREAGGLLLGLRRDPHIEIVEATLPAAGDLRESHHFHRRDPSHQQAATRAWRKSGRIIDYVGEWHSHPEDRPKPSRLDRDEMLRRSEEHRGEALVELIVGWSELYAGLVCDQTYSHLK